MALAISGLAGCGEGDGRPAIPENQLRVLNTTVSILSVERDVGNKTITTDIAIGAKRRRVTLSSGDNATAAGFPVALEASFAEEDGSSLVIIEFGWDPDEPTRMWLREATLIDELVVRRDERDGRVYEQYDMNGDVFAFDYPRLSEVSMAKAARRFLQGESPVAPSPLVSEFYDKLTAFDTYYAPYAENSLQNNADGEILMALLSDAEFGVIVAGVDPSLRMSKAGTWLCRVVNACVIVKCLIFPNLACVPCTSMSIGCYVFELACAFLCGGD
ncbi:MAG TPA: hypothetical protein VFX92_00560 [Candidatus Krumholzibacteria bacterium]|nr:hypothetical protein [Candidatus Krumholzibacteria bacterium]